MDAGIPRKYRDCASADQKIAWLNSSYGQQLLIKRPRLQELHRANKLQYMVNHPEWARKLDIWLSDGGWMENIASMGREVSSLLFGSQSNSNHYTFHPEPFSQEVKLHILVQGYALLRGYFPMERCIAAVKHINYRIGLLTSDTSVTRDQSKLTSIFSSDPAVLGLYNNSPLAASVSLLLHNSCPNIGSTASPNFDIIAEPLCQLALRFPENSPPPPNTLLGGLQWHTDGMDKGDYAPFTLLVGVALTDQPAPLHGNLCVFENSHYTLQDDIRTIARSTPPYDMSYARRDLGEPVQLQLRVGDVVLLHQKLAHRGGPHFGHEIRKMVYFRIKHRRHEELKLAATENLWLEFEGMHDVL